MIDNNKILIVEDDLDLANILKKSFQKINFEVEIIDNFNQCEKILNNFNPNFVLVDLKINGQSGLEVIKLISSYNSSIKIVVLTGFASITTTISAIKSGACYYLAKPATFEMITSAFGIYCDLPKNNYTKAIFGKKTSIKNIEWEHINSILEENNFNISKTAKSLNMHRRTLVRKLQKSVIKN